MVVGEQYVGYEHALFINTERLVCIDVAKYDVNLSQDPSTGVYSLFPGGLLVIR